mmetsp:Transcript_48589/g.92941  ORF Transcript_48589/g.92941 Transcript_48589/m.92941 type:complete len:213 (-) Transcript_48589:195-833(-)
MSVVGTEPYPPHPDTSCRHSGSRCFDFRRRQTPKTSPSTASAANKKKTRTWSRAGSIPPPSADACTDGSIAEVLHAEQSLIISASHPAQLEHASHNPKHSAHSLHPSSKMFPSQFVWQTLHVGSQPSHCSQALQAEHSSVSESPCTLYILNCFAGTGAAGAPFPPFTCAPPFPYGARPPFALVSIVGDFCTGINVWSCGEALGSNGIGVVSG